MKKIITLLLFITKITFAQSSSFENDSILIWNENRKITWNDFKSQNKVHSYEQASAVMATGLIAYPKNIVASKIKEVKIIATVNKNQSWYKIKEDYILNHEQMHFNITEIYARKFRKELAKIEESGNKISPNVLNELDDFKLDVKIEELLDN